MKRSSLVLALVCVVGAAGFLSCGGKSPTEATPPTAAAPAPAPDEGTVGAQAMSSMRWRMVDRCPVGLQWRLFDKTDRRTRWPSAGVYRVRRASAITKTISCVTNHKICYGGTTDPATAAFFGVGLNGNKGCTACCTACRPVAVQVTISCSSRFDGLAPEGDVSFDVDEGDLGESSAP